MSIEGTLASRLYTGALRAGEAGTAGMAGALVEPGGPSFADALEAAARDMMATIEAGERSAQAAIQGRADVQTVVEALAATEMALQTAVTLRDRVVEAYQEILRMPV